MIFKLEMITSLSLYIHQIKLRTVIFFLTSYQVCHGPLSSIVSHSYKL